MVQMVAPSQKAINITSMFFDPNRDSAAVGRAALQSAGLSNAQYHLDLETAKAYLTMSMPQLIIVDLSPDTKIDGLKLVAAIRREKRDDAPRVLGLLASGTRETLIEAIKGGCDTIIAKPLAPGNLHKKIVGLMAAPQNYIDVKNYYGPDRRRIPSEDEFTGEDRRSK